MVFWFYDEPGFPSGSADGRVVMANPDVELKGLSRSQRMLRAGETYRIPDDALDAFVQDTYPIRGSYTARQDVLVAEYRIVPERPYPMRYPDLIDDRSTETLIKVLYEKYDKYIGHLFGSAIPAVFIDEPKISSHPWTHGFEKLFSDRFGYDIRDYLPAVMNPFLQGEKGTQARIDYYELNSELFCTRYFLRQRAWCRAHGLLLGGHLGGEDETYGCIRHGYLHLMRMLRSMDLPGIDAIWRQIFPGHSRMVRSNLGTMRTCENRFFPRYASSAANQAGGGLSLTETGAVYGSGLTCDQLRYVTMFQMVRGINIINYMSVFFSCDEHLMASMRPNFVREIPHSSDWAVFNAYIARMSYLMTAGRIDVCTALYMPMRDIWADDTLSARIVSTYEDAAVALERAQCYFDIFDDDAVLLADERALDDGVLRIGLVAYRILIIPPCRFMPSAVKDRLDRFAAGGGSLIVISDSGAPFIGRARQANISQLASCIEPVVTVSPACEQIRAIRRITPDGARIYLVTNEDDRQLRRTIAFDETLPVYEVNALNGGICIPDYRTVSGRTHIDIRLGSGEGRVFLFTNEHLDASGEEPLDPESWTTIETLTSFEFRRLGRFVVEEHRLEWEDLREPGRPIAPGDWSDAAGRDFSGDALYRTTFARPFGSGTVHIDLGDVKYSSEAFLNGKSLGVRCMAPYAYTIRDDELTDTNTLEIRVSNTAANQFVARDRWLMDKYTLKRLGNYHPLSVDFERDSIPSGLYGPVRICRSGRKTESAAQARQY